jgi:hypothetical protein
MAQTPRCHLCQRELQPGKGEYSHRTGLWWCIGSTSCYYHARLRLGIPQHVAHAMMRNELGQALPSAP